MRRTERVGPVEWASDPRSALVVYSIIQSECGGLGACRRLWLKKAAVKETVASLRLSSVFTRKQAIRAADCARECARSRAPDARRHRRRKSLARTHFGSGRRFRTGSLCVARFPVSVCISYTWTSAVRWPRGWRRRFA